MLCLIRNHFILFDTCIRSTVINLPLILWWPKLISSGFSTKLFGTVCFSCNFLWSVVWCIDFQSLIRNFLRSPIVSVLSHDTKLHHHNKSRYKLSRLSQYCRQREAKYAYWPMLFQSCDNFWNGEQTFLSRRNPYTRSVFYLTTVICHFSPIFPQRMCAVGWVSCVNLISETQRNKNRQLSDKIMIL